jgi:hypothetical protein
MKRVSPKAAPIPITTPMKARRIPCQTTRERMRERSAPRAMRIVPSSPCRSSFQRLSDTSSILSWLLQPAP